MFYALILAMLAADPKKAAAPKPKGAERQYTFSDLPLAKGDDATGQRFYASGEIVSIKPNPTKVDDFVVRVMDTSEKNAGAYIRWVSPKKPSQKSRSKTSAANPSGYWLSCVCEFHLNETRATRLHEESEATVTGDIEGIDMQGGLDAFRRGDAKVIVVRLSGVRVR